MSTVHKDSETWRLMESLAGTTCPADGKNKRRNQTFCGSCYYALPPDKRQSLYDRLDDGYAEAVDDAFATLREAGRTKANSIMDAQMPRPEGSF